jgi:hypothetical protein
MEPSSRVRVDPPSDPAIAIDVSRRGVGCTFGRGLSLSIRLVGFVRRLILVAYGSPHRSQVPGAQPLEAIRRRPAHLVGDRRGHPELSRKFDHGAGRLARLVALAAVIVGCLGRR